MSGRVFGREGALLKLLRISPGKMEADFKSFQERVSLSLVNVTRTAGQIAAEDLSFHRSSNAGLSKSLDAQNARLLALTSKLLKAATKDTSITPPRIQDTEQIEDEWKGVVDVIDDLLEKSDACLDEYTGIIKRLSPGRRNAADSTPRPADRVDEVPSIFSNTPMAKPQLLFSSAPDNFESTPFRPLLKSKPHAIVPMGGSVLIGEEHG